MTCAADWFRCPRLPKTVLCIFLLLYVPAYFAARFTHEIVYCSCFIALDRTDSSTIVIDEMGYVSPSREKRVLTRRMYRVIFFPLMVCEEIFRETFRIRGNCLGSRSQMP
jgi:hypothetical protein